MKISEVWFPNKLSFAAMYHFLIPCLLLHLLLPIDSSFCFLCHNSEGEINYVLPRGLLALPNVLFLSISFGRTLERKLTLKMKTIFSTETLIKAGRLQDICTQNTTIKRFTLPISLYIINVTVGEWGIGSKLIDCERWL